MTRQLRSREGALGDTSERNRLAAELRRRRSQKQLSLPAHDHGWSDEDIADSERSDLDFQKQLDEIRRLKDRLLP